MFIGDEKSPEELFFNKYFITGLIGCRQLYQRFAMEELKAGRLRLEGLDAMQQLAAVAKHYYGKSLQPTTEISDGGRPLHENDSILFSKYQLPEDENVQTLTEQQVLAHVGSMFGSEKPLTEGFGDFVPDARSANELFSPEVSSRAQSLGTATLSLR
jgi:hypothetical protein